MYRTVEVAVLVVKTVLVLTFGVLWYQETSVDVLVEVTQLV